MNHLSKSFLNMYQIKMSLEKFKANTNKMDEKIFNLMLFKNVRNNNEKII